ncbi:MAG TPA: hypothetical protein VKH81_21410 [Candidatus Angelobacter sp.]|nr:hypothetical protein [Candidatus Angelobacter sp.]
MSTSVLEPTVEHPVAQHPASQALVTANPALEMETAFSDLHPLLPVLVAGAVALLGSLIFVGSIVAGLLLRNSGIMAQ